VTTDFGARDEARGVAIQADGGIVVAGTRVVFGNDDFIMARYTPDGELDSSFDGDGKQQTDFAGESDDARALAVRELGGGEVRIVVAGSARTAGELDGALAAYTTDGSPDATFGGGDGMATFELSGAPFDRLYDVAFQADGKILASGIVEAPGFGLIRTTSAGSLDPSFGGDGRVSTAFGPGQIGAQGVAVQPNSRIVAAGGELIDQSGSDFFLARYLASAPAPPGPTPPGGGAAAPSNAFTLGKLKGKTLKLNLPSAGVIGVANAGSKKLLKRSSAAGGPGTIAVKLRLTKAGNRTLREKGKLRVRARITFTPNGGTAATQTTKLKIKTK
jgi:uncharacterized delta-60 repeat protein